jgi:hypothetical protein
MRYDRQLLLGGAKRNAVLDLREVQRYGIDSYGDADYVSVYGMRPAEWYANGIRLLGRTAVECTRDGLADAIGKDVAAIAATAPRAGGAVVIDPFAGSGNTLQVYETVDVVSLTELKARFDWSALRVYGLNAPGENHGILLGTRGWAPEGE